MKAPRSFSWLKTYVESELSSASDKYHVRIGEGLLAWDGLENAFTIQISEMQVLQENNQVVAVFPNVKLELSLTSFLSGSFGFSSLNIVEPSFHLELGTANLDDSTQNSPDKQVLLASLASLLLDSGDWNMEALPNIIRITEGKLFINNGTSILAWQIPQGYVAVNDEEKKLEFTLDFGNTSSLFSATINNSSEDSDLPSITLSAENFPSYILSELFPEITMLNGIDVVSSTTATVKLSDLKELETIDFNITKAEGNVTLKEYFPDTLSLKNLKANGKINLNDNSLLLSTLEAKFTDVTFNVNGSIQNLGTWEKPEIVMDTQLHIYDINTDMLGLYWPIPLGVEARTWVVTNLSEGKVTKAKGQFVIREGEYGKFPYPAKMIDATVEFQGVTARLPDPLPPVVNGNGSAYFDAHHMKVTLANGELLNSEIIDTSVIIPDWWKEPYLDLNIKGIAEGDVTDVLEVAKRYIPKESQTTNSTLSLHTIQNASGTATTSLSLSLPLADNIAYEDVEFTVTSQLTNAGAENLFPDISLEKGELTVTVTPQNVVVKGDGSFASVPLNLDITQSISDKPRTQYHIKTTAPASALSKLGLGTIPYISNEIALDITGEKSDSAHNISGTVDAKNSSIIIPTLGYTKKIDVPWMLSFSANQNDQKSFNIPQFEIKSLNFNAKGEVKLSPDKSIEKAIISPLSFDSNQLENITFISNAAQNTIALKGKTLDLSKAKFGSFLQSLDKDDNKKALKFNAELDTLLLKNDGAFRNFSAKLECQSSFCQLVDVYTNPGNDNYLVVNLKPTAEKHTLMVESDNAGAVINALDISKHIKGGQLEIQAVLDRDNNYTVADGMVTIYDFIAIKTPLLGKLFTLASFNGILDLLEGKGINFKRFEAPFNYQNGILTIKDGRSSGASVGITAEGSIDTNTSQMNINGSVVPAQAVNTLVNKIPLVGTIITGGESQGVIAASYSIKGPIENVEASVNPLSIITPGILRKLFEIFPDSIPENKLPDAITTQEKPDKEKLDDLWEKKNNPEEDAQPSITP